MTLLTPLHCRGGAGVPGQFGHVVSKAIATFYLPLGFCPAGTPPRKGIKILPATLSHANDIHSIELESFADPWSVSSIEHEISNEYSTCLVALDDSLIVGHVSMRHIINEGHINNIAVSKAYRQQGVASLILHALINKAIRHEMIGLTLEVRVSNHAAIALYQKFGFITEGYRKNYYSMPSEDAAIMWKILPPQGCDIEVQE